MVTRHRVVVGHARVEPLVEILVPESLVIIGLELWCKDLLTSIVCFFRHLSCLSRHWGLNAGGWIRVWFAANECLISGAVDESLVYIWLREHGRERFVRHAINVMKKLGGRTFILLAGKQDLIPLLINKLLLFK